jgi:uncharacterized protein (TIGR03437 family)
MGALKKSSGHKSPLLLAVCFGLSLCLAHAAPAQESPPPGLKIAFLGDQSLGPNAVAVLNLVKLEGAQAVLHSGDLDYADDPAAWEAQVNGVLGANFPYFVTIGNHDELMWAAPNGYQQLTESRFKRLGLGWTGRLGVRSSFHYKGIFFVLAAPGITSGFDDGASDVYVRDQLAADHSVWSVCSWHKNMRLMQVGGKEDETGWAVYEEARKGGAIIATAHEHSYSRTHLLSSMVNQTVAGASNTLRLAKGNSFAFVSGLGGHSQRAQSIGGGWWASIYAATCLANDPVCQPNASPGALFGVFNVDGQPNKALFYFKDINGRVVDQFVVYSNVETPFVGGLAPASATAGGGGFTLTVDGAGFVDGSVVQLNGAARPTTFVSPTQLKILVTAADLAVPGSFDVTVVNPAPGGGASNAKTFQVDAALPRLLTDEVTGRAIALDSVNWLSEPFAVLTPYNFSADGHTRISLFAAGVVLAPGEGVSVVTAQAEDSRSVVYPLAVEYVGSVPGFDWLTQVIVKLPGELEGVGEVRVSIRVRGVSSNKVPLGLQLSSPN